MATAINHLVPHGLRAALYRRQPCALRHCLTQPISHHPVERGRTERLQFGPQHRSLLVCQLPARRDTSRMEQLVSARTHLYIASVV